VGQCLAGIADVTGACVGYLFRYDAAANLLAPSAWWRDGHLHARPDPEAPPLLRGSFDADVTPAFRALTQATDILAVDLECLSPADAALAWPGLVAWHLAHGRRWACAIPILVGTQRLGVVGLAWDRPVAFAPEERELLFALAGQAALVMQLDALTTRARTAAVAEERTRVAREMHDTLAQGLAGIVMQLRVARTKLGSAAGSAAPALDRVERLARENLADARRSIAMLRPAALDEHGIDAALAEVVAAARDAIAGDAPASGAVPHVEFGVRGTPVRLPADVEMELLRVAQAALANAVQHAAARAIRVELAFDLPVLPSGAPDGGSGDARGGGPEGWRSRGVRIAVVDDGRGFDGDAVPTGRFGLVGMSERAARVGAVFTVVTAPGEGTEVVVMWRAAPGGSP
jgi:signal transduction histidine kinase